MRLRTLIIISTLVLFWLVGIAHAEYIPKGSKPSDINAAVEEANKYLEHLFPNYFESTNVNNLPISKSTWAEKSLIAYGSKSGDQKGTETRYIGETYEGDLYTNIEFLHDDWNSSKKLEERNWIRDPWNNDVLRKHVWNEEKRQLHPSRFNSNPEYQPLIVKGIQDFYAKDTNRSRKDWYRYVYVLQPPTYFSKGMGRLWHQTANGQIWYITVPIAAGKEVNVPLPNLYAKDLIPLDSTGNYVYQAWAGVQYKARVTFGVQNLPTEADIKTLPIFIAAGLNSTTNATQKSPMTFKAGNGKIESLNPWWFWSLFNVTIQSVKFNGQNAEVVVEFPWTPQTNTKELVAAINQYPAFHVYYEGPDYTQYEDNVVRTPVKVVQMPDFYVKSVRPGTGLTEAGKTYTGSITVGLKNDYKTNSSAKVELKHNGTIVDLIDIDEDEVWFTPGQERTFTFKYTGVLNENSLLVGRILPGVDRNYGNNVLTTTVAARKTDIAVTSLDQNAPIFINTGQSTLVEFKNLGTQTETFTPEFYVNKKKTDLKSPITLKAGEEVPVPFTWTAPATPGNVDIEAVAVIKKDAAPGNNRKKQTIKVNGIPSKSDCDTIANKLEGQWPVTYHWTTTNKDGTTSYHEQTVTYNEELRGAKMVINTHQGETSNPAESRGAWELVPYAKKNKLNPNQVTRAGYGFDVTITAKYWTDYETKVPPHAAPIGEDIPPLKAYITITNTKNVKQKTNVELTGTKSTNSDGEIVYTWTLPKNTTKLSNGKLVTDNKFYIPVSDPDGEYTVKVVIMGGHEGLTQCIDDYVVVYGTMYDDIYTSPSDDPNKKH